MKKIVKTGIILVAVILIISIAGNVFIRSIEKNLSYLPEMEIKDPDLIQIPDGVYKGSYAAFPVIVDLSVTVKNHEITDIEILKHQNGQGKEGESIVNSVMQKQSLQVDAVSGATYSSIVILKAVENALSKIKE